MGGAASKLNRRRTLGVRAYCDRHVVAMVRRGTCFAALFYRICVAIAVNEEAAVVRCWVPASRYNRSSLTTCWPGHLYNHHQSGFSAEVSGQIPPEKPVSALGRGVASRWKKCSAISVLLSPREEIISWSEMSTLIRRRREPTPMQRPLYLRWLLAALSDRDPVSLPESPNRLFRLLRGQGRDCSVEL